MGRPQAKTLNPAKAGRHGCHTASGMFVGDEDIMDLSEEVVSSLFHRSLYSSCSLKPSIRRSGNVRWWMKIISILSEEGVSSPVHWSLYCHVISYVNASVQIYVPPSSSGRCMHCTFASLFIGENSLSHEHTSQRYPKSCLPNCINTGARLHQSLPKISSIIASKSKDSLHFPRLISLQHTLHCSR